MGHVPKCCNLRTGTLLKTVSLVKKYLSQSLAIFKCKLKHVALQFKAFPS